GTVFSQKCMEDFEKKIIFPYICINGHSKEVKEIPCRAGEDFYIEDFVLHTSRVTQSSLNKIVQGVHLLCVDYGCIPDKKGFEVDICSFSSLVGCMSFYILLKSKLLSSEIRPSSCSCSIKSPSKSIAVRPLDVRLKATDTLRSYQGRDDIGYDIFEKNYFLWSMDGPTVFHTDYLNITLTTREKWQPWNNLLIRIQ
ncbi:hypothetical protein BgiBS90_026249, partial [Biomphalaria glabrata]